MENVMEGLYNLIRDHSEETIYQEGECVYRPGDPSNNLYLIIEGRVKLSYLNHDGRSLTLMVLQPGEIFGELALAGLEHRETKAEVLERASLWAIDRQRFLDLLRERAELSLQIMRLVVERLRQLEERLEAILREDPAARSSLALLQLFEESEEEGSNADAGPLLDKEELEALLRVAMAQGAIATPPSGHRMSA